MGSAPQQAQRAGRDRQGRETQNGRQRRPFKLPLLGSNQDSPDPEGDPATNQPQHSVGFHSRTRASVPEFSSTKSRLCRDKLHQNRTAFFSREWCPERDVRDRQTDHVNRRAFGRKCPTKPRTGTGQCRWSRRRFGAANGRAFARVPTPKIAFREQPGDPSHHTYNSR